MCTFQIGIFKISLLTLRSSVHKSMCNMGLWKQDVGLYSSIKRNQTLPTCFLDYCQGGVKTSEMKTFSFYALSGKE